MPGLLLITLIFLFSTSLAQKPPDQVYGTLFHDVQTSGIFSDSKTFVDCIPRKDPDSIVAQYLRIRKSLSADAGLKKFIEENFYFPSAPDSDFQTSSADLKAHINRLWKHLKKEKDSLVPGSSLLPLPFPYIIPGGRFREIYYWDSYFTMLGLKESREHRLIQNLIDNFSHLVHTYGLIPNGNRSYYLTRSQPPFFSLMVELSTGIHRKRISRSVQTALEKEYRYWITGNSIELEGKKYFIYSDRVSIPRQESYKEDLKTGIEAVAHYGNKNPYADQDSLLSRTYQHIRAAAASGWDFSSRWFRDSVGLRTIQTADIIPVDLNCLVFNLENLIRKSKGLPLSSGKKTIQSFRKMFYNESIGWYCDYNMQTKKTNGIPTLAGMYPLFFRLADKKDIPAIVSFLKKNFLKRGGVVTSLTTSGEQWDAPNGWAPLQWITIIGLENYGYHTLAKEIATRWFRLNKKVFENTGRLMEKYNVVNTELEAGGGEYPSQDGFGWTNGVLLALMKKYDLK